MKSILALLFLTLALTAHAESTLGSRTKVGKGYAYTYVNYDYKHKPKSIGIVLTEAAMEGLPATDQMFSLKLPEGAAVAPYKEIVVNWNPQGHEPPEIYGLPHFDFHFYTISKTLRETITCMDEDHPVCMKQPPTDMIAPYFIPAPGGVPMMGWHWLDSRSPELHGEKFTSTFIYGYYNGKMIFLEPMITREFLMSGGHVNQKLSRPERYAYKGWYPKNYTLTHDKKLKLYRIELKNLVKFQ